MSGSDIRRAVAGVYHPPGSARSIPARLVRDGPGFVIEIEGAADRPVDLGTITLSDRIAGVPRRLELADGAAFVTRDDDALEAALGGTAGRGPFAVIARLERPSLRLFVFGSLAVIAIVASLRWGIPAAAGFFAWATPQPVSHQFGRGTLASLDEFMLKPSRLDEATRARTSADFDRIAAAAGIAGRVSLDFRRGGPAGANAFAMPGGVIVVTDELVDASRAPDEVAGVIAHELAHAEFRHPEQAMWRTFGVGLALGILFGDAGSLAEYAAAAGQLLIELSYSRDQELEADARAVALMAEAGLVPGHFVVILDRLLEKCAPRCDRTSWLSSHPGGVERRQALCTALADPGPARSLCAGREPAE